MKLKYDKEIDIAIANNRRSKIWESKKFKLSEFYERLSKTKATSETQKSYLSMDKDKQADIKDAGGFVGGILKGGKRSADNVISRCLITLDADNLTEEDDIWFYFTLKYSCSACVYSTHKHSPSKPRLRLIVPLDRGVSPEEYEAIARRLAFELGIDLFDDTTYQANRLMFFPTTSVDGEFIFDYADGEILSADEMLSKYVDWRDVSSWHFSSRVDGARASLAKKQGDPLKKKGWIGAFCRTYPLDIAIDKFLSDIYTTSKGGRYSYVGGSTASGVVVYDDKFAYSHHSTDPCSMQLCNAFDLVRVHLFGHLDGSSSDMHRGASRPSYQAMIEFISTDEAVKAELGSNLFESLDEEEEDDKNDDWVKKLEYTKQGSLIPSRTNVILILNNDSKLKKRFAYNSFSIREIATADLPWRKVTPNDNALSDSDDANLRCYLEGKYRLNSSSSIKDALTHVAHLNGFHPIKTYLNGLEWDGIERVDTLLIDYLNVEDSEYVRQVTRKTLTAAVARIFEPGTKFDSMLTLVGPQGTGKSTLVNKLGKGWYSSLVTDLKGKDAMENLQGNWIIEMEELSSMRKSESEAVKAFISKTVDTYRVAYGHRTSLYPRQCIFIGTTNANTFLRDSTGNRRFWIVEIEKNDPLKMWSDEFDKAIDQVWAEAKYRYEKGEKLYIEDAEVAKVAIEKQLNAFEEDPKAGLIAEYLERKISKNWYGLSVQDRVFMMQEGASEEGEIERQKVCALEIWCECYGLQKTKITAYDTKEINSILDGVEGWKRASSPMRFGAEYGPQRGCIRVK